MNQFDRELLAEYLNDFLDDKIGLLETYLKITQERFSDQLEWYNRLTRETEEIFDDLHGVRSIGLPDARREIRKRLNAARRLLVRLEQWVDKLPAQIASVYRTAKDKIRKFVRDDTNMGASSPEFTGENMIIDIVFDKIDRVHKAKILSLQAKISNEIFPVQEWLTAYTQSTYNRDEPVRELPRI